jgi:hypothetical protein
MVDEHFKGLISGHFVDKLEGIGLQTFFGSHVKCFWGGVFLRHAVWIEQSPKKHEKFAF